MEKKLKICLVGGEDAHKRIGLSEKFIARGYEVTILGSKAFNYPKNIEFIQYDLNRKLNIVSDVKTVLKYKKIFSVNQFDIIQTFDTKPAFLVPISLPKSNTQVVRTITGLGTLFMSSGIKFSLLRFIYKSLHRIAKSRIAHTTFQNEEDRYYFLQNNLVTKENSSLIYGSGIELDKYNLPKQKTKRFTFISVGRLVYEKGIVNYLEAAEICHSRGYDFRFLLVGPLEEKSKKLNAKILAKYEKHVEWLGQRNDIPHLLSQSDAFVLPTFREGFSRVLLEATAIGIPSITTNVPGTREIIRNNKEGLLIDVNDSIGLADAMINLAIDVKQYGLFVRNGRKHIVQFELNEISMAYKDLYQKLCK